MAEPGEFRFETGCSPTTWPPACASTTTIRNATTGWTATTPTASGNFTYASSTRAGQDNRIEEIFATAIYLEDEIKTGKLTLRPGIRYEWLELDDRNTVNATPATSRAASREQSGDENLFHRRHRAGITNWMKPTRSTAASTAASVRPAPANYLEGVEAEESVGYELGIRHRRDALNLELTGFLHRFRQPDFHRHRTRRRSHVERR